MRIHIRSPACIVSTRERWMEMERARARVKRSLGQGRWQLGVNGQAAPACEILSSVEREIVGQVVLATTSRKEENER